MDLIDETLTTQSKNKMLLASIRTATEFAKTTLNRYYQLTDSSDVYRIAMGTLNIMIDVLTTKLRCT